MDPNFWSNGSAQKKEQLKEDHIFWSNGRVQISVINKWGIYFLGKWSCRKEIINETGLYILVKWSFANKRNKSMRTLILGRIVVQKKNKGIVVSRGIEK